MTPQTLPALRETVSLDFLVPLADNHGVPFQEADYDAFEREVLDLTGGITRRSDVDGRWLTPAGDIHSEQSRSYTTTVDAPELPRVAGAIEALIRTTFRQFAAFVQATPTLATHF